MQFFKESCNDFRIKTETEIEEIRHAGLLAVKDQGYTLHAHLNVGEVELIKLEKKMHESEY